MNGDSAARVGSGEDGSGTATAAARAWRPWIGEERAASSGEGVAGRGLRIGEERVAGGCSGVAAVASRRGEGGHGSDGSGRGCGGIAWIQQRGAMILRRRACMR